MLQMYYMIRINIVSRKKKKKIFLLKKWGRRMTLRLK